MGKPEVVRDEKGRVVGGTLNPSGRPPGPNKLTADMKAMIEEALKQAGEDVQKRRPGLKGLQPGVAYLAEQAHRNPVAFMGLLRQLLPAKVDLEVTAMSRDLAEALSQRRDQLARLKDITPQEEEDEDADNARND
jgi:hypothetical protein